MSKVCSHFDATLWCLQMFVMGYRQKYLLYSSYLVCSRKPQLQAIEENNLHLNIIALHREWSCQIVNVY